MYRHILIATTFLTFFQCPLDEDPEPDVVEPVAVPPLETANDGVFATSGECRDCHSNLLSSQAMRDPMGRPVGMYDLWSGSMMANSARDPLWRAVVSAEKAATPSAAAAIEAKCMRCHAPMASEDVAITGQGSVHLGLLTEGSELGNLALDGVSCTVCHQISADNLGQAESYSGGFEVREPGKTHAPHQDPFGGGMTETSGFEPVYATHILDSELCATCHTLYTDALTAGGAPTGDTLPEQTAYLEWLNSSFSRGAGARTCQGCHLPTLSEEGETIVTAIARGRNGMDIPAIYPRSPYGRHLLVGGNTLIPAILRDNQDTLNPLAGADAFATTVEATRRHLERETGALELVETGHLGDHISLLVKVVNLSGHKLPTGIPLRRVWLRVDVSDASGATIYTSGAWDRAGNILDQDGDPLPSEAAGGPILPHLDVIDEADEVQVYEAIMADPSGQPTFTLLRAAGFLKDDRLLPAGWQATFPGVADIAPRGVAGDPDFIGGSDHVVYQIDVGRNEGPFSVDVQLVFQPLSTRFARELFTANTPETKAFKAMWEGVQRDPEIIDALSFTVY